ncbi:MAG: cytochrome c [Elusimicrobia bacterium]|nr:cytochrome c [Elusimicrobiota bacterium]
MTQYWRCLAAGILVVFVSPARAGDGLARFDAAGCRACHRIGSRGGDAGPDLTLVGVRRPRAWIALWLKSPHAWKPDTKMPEQGLSDADRGALADFLAAQKGQAWGEERPWRGAEPGEISGRAVYLRAGCVACHGPAGRGGHPNPGAHGDVIPALAPLMSTYNKEELKAKIRNGVVPETNDGRTAAVVMPPWKDVLDDDELDALTTYLLSLGEGQPKSDW